MSGMFSELSDLTSITFGENFDTSNVHNMTNMFENCQTLTSLDLSNFNTSSVRNMSGMFEDCSALTSLDLSSFDTSNVFNMDYMFYNCTSLSSLDVSNWCVEDLSEPTEFATNAPFANTPSNLPAWGENC